MSTVRSGRLIILRFVPGEKTISQLAWRDLRSGPARAQSEIRQPMNATPAQLKRATRDEAQTAWSRLNAKQRNSVVGRTYQSIIEFLDDTGAIALGPLLDALFADRDLRAAHTALKTQFIARPPRDETDQPLMQLCVSALPKLRGGGEAERLQALRAAQVWFDIPEHVNAVDFAVPASEDVAQNFTESRATDRSSEEALAQSKSNALRMAETAQVASARGTSLFHGTQSIRGLDRHGPFVPGQGVDAPLGKKRDERHTDDDDTANANPTDTPAATDTPTQVVALPTLLKWARNADAEAPRLYALLGDSGTGKTSHAQEFARVLNGESTHSDWPSPDAVTGKEPALPKALFFDLADLSGVPNLEQLSLEEMLVLLLKRRDGIRVQVVADVAPLVADARAGRIIFVFDGLDELLKTDPLVLQKVFEQLIKVVERPGLNRTSAPLAGRPPKVIVSCRTHYFRDVETQHSFFLARGRGAVKATDYRVLTLLPWNAELIERYLASRVGAAEAARLLRVIETTYNLSELASRPVLLAMMCGTLETLLSRADHGERIDAAALYSETVAAWIHRDNGKHRLSPAQKPLLMGALATAMWNDGSELWPADRLDQWVLHAVRELFPNQYSPAELRGVQDDLRTATFIVRPDAQQFNFAHRSYGEYFTARFLLEGMSQVADGFWSLATLRAHLPTRALGPETHDFLVEMWRSDQRKLPAQTLKRRTDVLLQLLEGGDAAPVPAPPLHAALWQLVCATRWPLSSVGNATGASQATDDAINLRGLDFSDQRWENLDFTHAPPLDLRGASLRGLYALNCRFGVVQCDAQTNWSQSALRGCETRKIDWADSDRGGILVRQNPATPLNTSVALPGLWAMPTPVLSISAVAMSEDCSLIASLNDRGIVHLWDAVTGRKLDAIKVQSPYAIGCIDVSDDGRLVATGGSDKVVRLWDVHAREFRHTLNGHVDRVRCVAINSANSLIVSGDEDGAVRVWNVESGQQKNLLTGHSASVQAVGCSEDGALVVSGCLHGKVRVWDGSDGKLRHVINAHNSAVRCVAVGEAGKLVVSVGHDGTVVFWDATTGRVRQTLAIEAGGAFSPWGFAYKEHSLAFGDSGGVVGLWNTTSIEGIKLLAAHRGAISSVDLSSDGKSLLSGSFDRTVRLWHVANRREQRAFVGHAFAQSVVSANSDASIICCGGEYEGISLIEPETGKIQSTADTSTLRVSCVAINSSADIAVTGGYGGVIRVWKLRNFQKIHSFQGHQTGISSVAISANAAMAVSGGEDHSVRVWDLSLSSQRFLLRGHSSIVLTVACSADGSRIVSADLEGVVRLWEGPKYRKHRILMGRSDGRTRIAMSANGALVAGFGTDGVIRVWNLQANTGAHIIRKCDVALLCVAVSADGKRVACAGIDGVIYVMDAESGRELFQLCGHGDAVTDLALSHDGATIISTSKDGTVRRWSPESTSSEYCRVFVPRARPPHTSSWAGFAADGALLSWSDNAPDHWLFYLGRGRSEPLEAVL